MAEIPDYKPNTKVYKESQKENQNLYFSMDVLLIFIIWF